MKKTICLVLFLVQISTLFVTVQPVFAHSKTLYFKEDGVYLEEQLVVNLWDELQILHSGNWYLIHEGFGNIVVEKSNIVIEGLPAGIGGIEGEPCILLNSVSNVVIKNMVCMIGKTGIFLNYSSHCTIMGVKVAECSYDDGITALRPENGIVLKSSSHCIITGNRIRWSLIDGIKLINSSYNTISDNEIFLSGDDGIQLWPNSNNNTISSNSIWGNYQGIHLSVCSNNTITENIITNNDYGIYPFATSNYFYLNDFKDNRYHVENGSLTPAWRNYWDDGDSKGNFWSDNDLIVDYNKDGVSDIPYEVAWSAYDHYPLMEPFSLLANGDDISTDPISTDPPTKPPTIPLVFEYSPVDPVSVIGAVTPMVILALLTLVVYVKKVRKR